ncbi:hypothetical protein PAXRUDRAFT_380588 [Paxillus rubicundulus Ve08.2h10]|uniref:Uncharacterized protein n=1 Tax=Paxillus rubicundulus Ve08.2h10 TaxID=930991 RepID=A0A0D0DDS9_9AGAM|nr:hypothetical protein PAXRUDRAFT_380588 [Paxillus rubicundulus Ve08.2h10]
MNLPPIPFVPNLSSVAAGIAASMGCPVPTTYDSGMPSSTPTSTSPAHLAHSVHSTQTTSGTIRPTSSLATLRSKTTSTSPAHLALSAHSTQTPSGTVRSTPPLVATPSHSGTPTPSLRASFTSTTFISISSQITDTPNLTISLSVSTSIILTSPVSSPTSAPIPQKTIVTASIGGMVALVAVLIVIYFRCRPRKPVITPYCYDIVPPSPRPSPTVQPEIKFGLVSHAPSLSITTQGSASSQHRRLSSIVIPSQCDMGDDNTTLCVPEDKSIAARRQRERELEKLYPVRPPRTSGEYGVGSASSGTGSSVYSVSHDV